MENVSAGLSNAPKNLWSLPHGFTRDKVQSVLYAIADIQPAQNVVQPYWSGSAPNPSKLLSAPWLKSGNTRVGDWFLDSVAHLMSPQKEIQGKKSQPIEFDSHISDAGHIAATVLIQRHGLTRVLVAKNSGHDEVDRQFCISIQDFVQDIAGLHKSIPVAESPFFRKLVRYNYDRVRYYVGKIKCHSVEEFKNHFQGFAPGLVQDLLNDCNVCPPEFHQGCHDLYGMMILNAHQLRLRMSKVQSSTQLGWNIASLGRLYTCYKDLIRFSLERPDLASDLMIIPIDAPVPEPSLKYKTILRQLQLLEQPDNGETNQVTNLYKKCMKKIARFSSDAGIKMIVHAEMQLLVQEDLATYSAWEFYDYMGGSRLPCYLCFLMLNHHGKYRSRESHDTVPSSWTLPDYNRLGDTDLGETSKVQEALIKTYLDMLHKLTLIRSNHEKSTTDVKPRRRQSPSNLSPDRSDPRHLVPVMIRDHRERQLIRSGRLIKTIRAIRLPWNDIRASTMKLSVHQSTHESLALRCGTTMNIQDIHMPISSRESAIPVLATCAHLQLPIGLFLIYWLQHFPETIAARRADNKYVINVLQAHQELIEPQEDLNVQCRPFWQGDIVIARLIMMGDPATPNYEFLDIPEASGATGDIEMRSDLEIWIEKFLVFAWRSDLLKTCLYEVIYLSGTTLDIIGSHEKTSSNVPAPFYSTNQLDSSRSITEFLGRPKTAEFPEQLMALDGYDYSAVTNCLWAAAFNGLQSKPDRYTKSTVVQSNTIDNYIEHQLQQEQDRIDSQAKQDNDKLDDDLQHDLDSRLKSEEMFESVESDQGVATPSSSSSSSSSYSDDDDDDEQPRGMWTTSPLL